MKMPRFLCPVPMLPLISRHLQNILVNHALQKTSATVPGEEHLLQPPTALAKRFLWSIEIFSLPVSLSGYIVRILKMGL